MAQQLTASFDTRREAEMTVERLVQQHGLARDQILVAPLGADNSVGTEPGGSEVNPSDPVADSDDAALGQRIAVTLTLDDQNKYDEVRAAFAEFDAEAVKVA